MKRIIVINIFLFVLASCLAIHGGMGQQSGQQSPPKTLAPTRPEPIRIDEADALRITNAYQGLQIVMLGIEKKYRIPETYAYNFAGHFYEPTAQSQLPSAPATSPTPK